MHKNIFIQDKEKLFLRGIMILACVCTLVQMYAIPQKNMLLMMLSNRTMVFMWIAAAVLLLFKNGVRGMVGTITMLLLAALSLIITASEPTQQVGSSFSALLNFIVLPLMLVFFAFCAVDEFTKQMLLFTNIVLSVLFIYLSRTRMAYRFDGPYFTIYTGDLSLGYPNPNQTAMYLFICALNLMVGCFYFKGSIIKILCAADFLYMLFLIEKTKCRTSLLLIIVFLVLVCVHKIPKVLIDIAVVIPLFYMLAARVAFPYFGKIRFMGENLFNGREEIYERYFENLDVLKFFFGDFAKFKFDNLHNAYISIAATVGSVVLLLYILMLRKHMLQNYNLEIHKGYERVAYIGFLCIILYSSTEAAGLIGGTNYAFMNISLFAYFSKPFAKPAMEEPG